MTNLIDNVIRAFSPRPLTDGERELLHDWVKAADDFLAFVSERRSDDAAIHRQIVVCRRTTRQRLYLVRPAREPDRWIVRSMTEGEDVGTFRTLRAALEFIRPPTLPAA